MLALSRRCVCAKLKLGGRTRRRSDRAFARRPARKPRGPFDARIGQGIALGGHHSGSHRRRNLEKLTRGAKIRESHRSPERDRACRIPTAFAARRRCTELVRDALAPVRARSASSSNKRTDNPLVFAESGEVISGGNFHARPWRWRRTNWPSPWQRSEESSERAHRAMTNPQTAICCIPGRSEAGLNSGFMILQVTAAALASEMKILAAPIPLIRFPPPQIRKTTSRWAWARRAASSHGRQPANILAIELLAACQGIDLLAPLRTGQKRARRTRSSVPFAKEQLTRIDRLRRISKQFPDNRKRGLRPDLLA